ncbi:hypothetical protein BJ508DRAFT_417222 [Ascobolus immersus RN42]|uniref:Ubiquitin-like domain-containing protein n=1 Tax=Ascobolus immersus RN42 TaxID=1160509 RepID=A0A3N4HZE4_ASCIM|nr:hypothetical protein BJ508DRAFT_417222 [Ascobolus immersus RN42]
MLSLLLKGRDRQEWKISVNKNSTVAKLIAKFKREHKIDADKEVQLQFDGEELEGDVKLVDTEVEDDDCLDVIFS